MNTPESAPSVPSAADWIRQLLTSPDSPLALAFADALADAADNAVHADALLKAFLQAHPEQCAGFTLEQLEAALSALPEDATAWLQGLNPPEFDLFAADGSRRGRVALDRAVGSGTGYRYNGVDESAAALRFSRWRLLGEASEGNHALRLHCGFAPDPAAGQPQDGPFVPALYGQVNGQTLVGLPTESLAQTSDEGIKGFLSKWWPLFLAFVGLSVGFGIYAYRSWSRKQNITDHLKNIENRLNLMSADTQDAKVAYNDYKEEIGNWKLVSECPPFDQLGEISLDELQRFYQENENDLSDWAQADFKTYIGERKAIDSMIDRFIKENPKHVSDLKYYEKLKTDPIIRNYESELNTSTHAQQERLAAAENFFEDHPLMAREYLLAKAKVDAVRHKVIDLLKHDPKFIKIFGKEEAPTDSIPRDADILKQDTALIKEMGAQESPSDSKQNVGDFFQDLHIDKFMEMDDKKIIDIFQNHPETAEKVIHFHKKLKLEFNLANETLAFTDRIFNDLTDTRVRVTHSITADDHFKTLPFKQKLAEEIRLQKKVVEIQIEIFDKLKPKIRSAKVMDGIIQSTQENLDKLNALSLDDPTTEKQLFEIIRSIDSNVREAMKNYVPEGQQDLIKIWRDGQMAGGEEFTKLGRFNEEVLKRFDGIGKASFELEGHLKLAANCHQNFHDEQVKLVQWAIDWQYQQLAEQHELILQLDMQGYPTDELQELAKANLENQAKLQKINPENPDAEVKLLEIITTTELTNKRINAYQKVESPELMRQMMPKQNPVNKQGYVGDNNSDQDKHRHDSEEHKSEGRSLDEK